MHNTLIQTIRQQPKIIYNLALRKNFWIIVFVDVLIVVCAHALAYAMRFDLDLSSQTIRITSLLPLLIVIKIPIFYLFGLYRGMWRYTSITDLFNISKAVAASSGVIIMTVLYLNRFSGFSRSVFILDGIFTFLFICAHRGTIRYILQNKELKEYFSLKDNQRIHKNLLLIGAGAAAEKVIREIRDNVNVPYHVVGLVDDDPQKHGLKIHGKPVLGDIDNLEQCIAMVQPDELLIAVASATADQMKRFIEACKKSNVKFKVLPSMGEIIKGKLSVTAIRDISYKDLLGRPVVHLEQEQIGKYLTNKTVLVTGAGGSIGSELGRQIIAFNPSKLILLDAGEENLYKVQMELHHEQHFLNYVPILCNIKNKNQLDTIFSQYKPSVIFHAAAYKHVPLVEENPWEAVFNNVFGTKGLIETAISHKTERFVLVSTDKAVRPTNVMGATKRLTELLLPTYCPAVPDHEGKQQCETIFMAVRFGNVLGSSGSVIPLFRNQIKKGGPLTVTHPEINRYFMAIEEAAQLILQAGAMGTGGEIFLLKMGQPVKIAALARDLIVLMGYEPEIDIKIEYTGLRPGEKLFEELITEGEGIVPTRHEKIMVLRNNNNSSVQQMEELLAQLSHSAAMYDDQGIKEILHKIIPEYSPEVVRTAVITADHVKLKELRN